MEGEAYNTQSSRDMPPTADQLVGHIYNQGLDEAPGDNRASVPVQTMEAIVELQNYDELRIGGIGKGVGSRSTLDYSGKQYPRH